MRVIAYSKALYSTWTYLETLRLLVDAGEGLNTHLEGRLLGVRDVALTHGHTDHFTGLHNLFVTRLRFLQETGDLEPVRLMWPRGESEIERHIDYLQSALFDRHPRLVELRPLNVGERVELPTVRRLTLVPFRVVHRGGSPCFGYRVLQERWRLKPELEGRPQSEIGRLAKEGGREAVATPEEVPLVVLSGDSQPLPAKTMADAELVFHESTFIGEQLEGSHSTLESAVERWRASGANRLVLYHFSSRYTRRDIHHALESLLPDPEDRKRIDFVAPGRLFDRDIRIGGL